MTESGDSVITMDKLEGHNGIDTGGFRADYFGEGLGLEWLSGDPS